MKAKRDKAIKIIKIKKETDQSSHKYSSRDERQIYLDRIKVISFKEREREIIARIKNNKISLSPKPQVQNTFWNKELKNLDIEKKSLLKKPNPQEYNQIYKNIHEVISSN